MAHDLVALDLPAGPAFVDELRRAWDDGDAVLPIDQRLPVAQRERLLQEMAATVVVSRQGVVRRSGRHVEPGDALVVPTSGSTGTPKGVVLTHDAVAASGRVTSAALGVDPARDTWLACLPVAHIGGLSVITRALYSGTPLVVHDRFDPDEVLAAARSGATLVSLVVTAMARIDTDAFRVILLGGSAIPADRPANTVATYGMTETGSGIVYDGSALAGVELRVVDGELHVKSPTLLRCYRDGSDPKTPDGWFPTGDAGSIDSDGRLEVAGRLAEVIVTGGEKVWPASVEDALHALPWVQEAAVIGRPDPIWGQEVTAIVVVSPGHEIPELDAIRDELGGTLPRYALPKRVERRDSLPRTTLGKVRRHEL
jgi:O-succinylbenzoic acid--CoA ligase